MIKWLLSVIGYKEYWIRVVWKDGREDNVAHVYAWGPVGAAQKVAQHYDIAGKALMEILEPENAKIKRIEYTKIKPKGTGVMK